jgi:hypothetical protein
VSTSASTTAERCVGSDGAFLSQPWPSAIAEHSFIQPGFRLTLPSGPVILQGTHFPGADTSMTTLARSPDAKAADDRSWYIVGRWGEFEGESRANLLRVVGIAAFYLVELANYQGFQLGGFEMPKVVDQPFHQAVTAVAVAWTMLGLGVQLCLSQRIFPGALKYVSTGGDLLLMTCVLAVSNGPKSPLVVGYFLILALASLRFSLPLIWFATVGSTLGYLVLLAHAKWFVPDHRVPRYHQAMFLLALGLTGITLGQVLRRVRKMAEDYAARREAEKDAA